MKNKCSSLIFLPFILILALLLSVFQEGLLFAKSGNKDKISNSINNKSELAVVAIFRDEARFLTEWIEYYRLHGITKFYLYNNLSKDNYKSVLKPYIKEGIVSLREWSRESYTTGSWNHIQVKAYKDGMSQARRDNVDWLIVIDVDEFIVPLCHETLIDLVRTFNDTDVGMLSALWMMFGTSNIKEVPKDKLMIETLLYNGGRGLAVGEKSILHTQRAITGGPHYGICHSGFTSIRLPLEYIQINHYWSRDELFFNTIKIPRRIKWGWDHEQSESFMNSFNSSEFPEISSPIQQYVPALRNAVEERKNAVKKRRNRKR